MHSTQGGQASARAGTSCGQPVPQSSVLYPWLLLVPEPRAPARMCCTPSAALLCNLLLHSVCSFVRVFL